MTSSTDSESRPTILVVDDEEDLRDIMRRMLERRGFEVLVAGNSQQATTVLREHPGHIAVLITDLGLPGVSGGELAKTATELRPGIFVIYISGLPKDIAVAEGLIGDDATLVKKPFTTDKLVEALRRILGLDDQP